ncbi:MAG: tetratricopeptide repeat protein [Chitinophagales bacterium]|nr:tetratricopeptide repeat protein [Chitinophagales bacterium]
MKKFVLFVTSLVLSFNVFSQSSAVVSAWNYIKSGEMENARTSIEGATQDSKTAAWPKTWFYRATIYLSMYDDSVMRKKHPEALSEAIKSYEKAMELNPKNEFKEQIQQGLIESSFHTFNNGVIPYNNKDYATAYASFRQSADINQYLNTTFNMKKVDTLSTLYAANAAAKGKKYDEATQLYQQLLDQKIMMPDIYSNLGMIYLAQGDTTKATNIISEGSKMYPQDEGLMVQELNVYLFSKKYDEAITKLNAAIQKEPKFTALYINLANVYEQQKDTVNARKTYMQALQVDPKSFDAFYRLGAMYYNQAVELNNQMNKLDLNAQKKYDVLKVDRDQLFKAALPYLEQAHQIDLKDMDTMSALKELYARLNMMDKLNDIKQEMDATKG